LKRTDRCFSVPKSTIIKPSHLEKDIIITVCTGNECMAGGRGAGDGGREEGGGGAGEGAQERGQQEVAPRGRSCRATSPPPQWAVVWSLEASGWWNKSLRRLIGT